MWLGERRGGGVRGQVPNLRNLCVSVFNHIHSSSMPSKCRDRVETGVSLGNAQVGAVGTVISMRTGVRLDTVERALEAESDTCDLTGFIRQAGGRGSCAWMAL